MTIRHEVVPFVTAVIFISGLVAGMLRWSGVTWTPIIWVCAIFAFVSISYLLYFFRDPERVPPGETDVIVAAADGTVASITTIHEDKYLHTECVRISIYLSLFDVHINRAPLAGQSSFLGYFPGRRLFTFQEKSSEVNQHNKIVIVNPQTRCLVCQIVGPVCRRVVYWPDHNRNVEVTMGERIGMMKFGSRLDLYFPKADVEILTHRGARVCAGETIIARIRKNRLSIKGTL